VTYDDYEDDYEEERPRGPGRPPDGDDERLFAAGFWVVHLAPVRVPCVTVSDVVAVLLDSDVPGIVKLVKHRSPGTIRNRISNYRTHLASRHGCEPAQLLPGFHFPLLSELGDVIQSMDLPVVWHPDVRQVCEANHWKFPEARHLRLHERKAFVLALLVQQHLPSLPIKARQEAELLCADLIKTLERRAILDGLERK
jgi:hypothetical protein